VRPIDELTLRSIPCEGVECPLRSEASCAGVQSVAVRVTTAFTGALSAPRTFTCAASPDFTFAARDCGTLTNTRSVSICEISNSPVALPLTLVGRDAGVVGGTAGSNSVPPRQRFAE